MNMSVDWKYCKTVDGTNPAPVDGQFFSLFTRFYTSQVVQDLFHQQDGLRGIFETLRMVVRNMGPMGMQMPGQVFGNVMQVLGQTRVDDGRSEC